MYFLDVGQDDSTYIHTAAGSFTERTPSCPHGRLPEGVKAGDAVIFEGDEIRLDPERKAKREKEIEDLMDELWEG